MVINGGSRAGAGELAAHLARVDTNERMEVREMRGVSPGTLREGLRQMEAIAAGTRCRKSLYHANLNPSPGEAALTLEQQCQAIDALERKMHLEGHPRVVVAHVKHGRAHLHVVWSRIDQETMKAVSDSHNYRRHEEVARELERQFGHAKVQGAHHEREAPEGGRQPRPPRAPPSPELQQAARTKRDPAAITAEVTRLWNAADSAFSFVSALHYAGYVLAQGKRGYCLVDPAGGSHSLARRIEGVRAKDVNARLAAMELSTLPEVDQVQAQIRQRDGAGKSPADPQRGFSAPEPAPERPQEVRREAEAATGREVPPHAPEAIPSPPDRRDGPDLAQQLADSADYMQGLYERNKAPEPPEPSFTTDYERQLADSREYQQERQEGFDRARADRSTVRPELGVDTARALDDAAREIGKASGTISAGISKAAGAVLDTATGLLGLFFGDGPGRGAGKAGAEPTASPTPRPPPVRPGREARPVEPAKTPKPPPSIIDLVEERMRAKQAQGASRPEPSKERDRDDGRSRFEARPGLRLIRALGMPTGWITEAKERLLAYSIRTGRAVGAELAHLEAILYRAVHGPA